VLIIANSNAHHDAIPIHEFRFCDYRSEPPAASDGAENRMEPMPPSFMS
jgi:hypothetical protein